MRPRYGRRFPVVERRCRRAAWIDFIGLFGFVLPGMHVYVAYFPPLLCPPFISGAKVLQRGQLDSGRFSDLPLNSSGWPDAEIAGTPFRRHRARDQLVLMKRFSHVVVGTQAETPDLIVYARERGENQDWRLRQASH